MVKGRIVMTTTERLIAQMQASSMMQAIADEYAQCSSVQEQVDLIGTLLGCYDPVRIADGDKYEACESLRERTQASVAQLGTQTTPSRGQNMGRDRQTGSL